MKKIIMFMVTVVAVVGLSGCGSSGSSNGGGNDDLTTLFLVDQDGFAYAGIPYICDSMNHWSATARNGEFSFFPGEDCEFDFLGLEGDYDVGPGVDDIIRIVDYTDGGKGGIPYECVSFGASTTFNDGSFFYDIDDECVFYF